MAKKVKKKELGLGIRALLSNIETEVAEDQEKVIKELSHSVAMIPVGEVELNPFQPRTNFEEQAMKDLAGSLAIHGLIQPITVRRLSDRKYQLISGERRLRAAKMAELKEVPTYIRIANDQEMLEMALVENIQREQLNPIEIALTFQRLLEECKLTQENLSGRVGKNRVTVTHFLGLLKLPPTIQEALRDKRISMGHGKALQGMDDIALQLSLFKQIIDKGLSVRATEEFVRKYKENQPARSKKRKPSLPEAYLNVQDNLSSHLGTRVQLKRKKDGNGQIVINFASDEDLNRLLDLIEE
ncbi:MAG: ParB/RepB/Spo0J family partition protein [Bacteroidetes bacterium]|nr:ParB/RepB/Spo0J family partition protein [Bacteroidota bacterium]